MDIGENGELRMVAKNPGVGGLTDLNRDATRGLLYRLRSRGSNDLFLLDTRTGKDTLLTEHTGPGTFFGQISPDGKIVYLGTNKNRDLVALGRMSI